MPIVKPDANSLKRASELVSANAERYPELLAHQLASAAQGEGEAVAAACRMRHLVGICLRMLERANVKPVGDEQIAYRLADEMTHADPRRRGGNRWLDEEALQLDLFGEAS